MKQQTFSLQPFPTQEDLPDINITGNISRDSHQLTINYQLTGNLKQILSPPPVETPTRQHELWRNTCFEFFLSIKNSQSYWEFNLSPAGNWNIYHFDGYRQGMVEETAFSQLPFNLHHQSDSLTLSLELDLAKIIPENLGLDIAITTVIKQHNHHLTYWALTHQGVEADFHLRESFILEL
jgi:hypothetical protein